MQVSRLDQLESMRCLVPGCYVTAGLQVLFWLCWDLLRLYLETWFIFHKVVSERPRMEGGVGLWC